MVDAVIVGAGPVGLACAIALKRLGLKAVIVEKGALVNSLVGYPTNMEFFSTPDLLEIGGHPLATNRYKPLREETIDYYRRVAAAEELDMRLYTRVEAVRGKLGTFEVSVRQSGSPSPIDIKARSVVVSTGFFDVPNLLNVPGEDLPHVTHYYKEPYGYSGQKVLVVGAKNSAAKAALQCLRNGASVAMVIRGPDVSDRVKYWLRPDLLNRIAEGSIDAHFNTRIREIHHGYVDVTGPDGPQQLACDFVLAMTGYRPDYQFLESLGVTIGTDPARTPIFDEESFETARPGMYLAGTVCGGLRTGRWFIENGRFHAEAIARHLATRLN